MANNALFNFMHHHVVYIRNKDGSFDWMIDPKLYLSRKRSFFGGTEPSWRQVQAAIAEVLQNNPEIVKNCMVYHSELKKSA